MFQGKKTAKDLRRNSAVIIQKYVRMFLAKLQLKFLSETKAAIFIQRFIRMWIAKAQLRELKSIDL
jgi:hypothetical protein